MYNEKLEDLFVSLREARDKQEIRQLEEQIWRIWVDSGNQQLNYLLEEGCEYLQEKKLKEAIECFTQIIALDPEFAEGWNKRATAYYMRGDLGRSLQDIQEVLRLEGRHFGALAGMASIYVMIQDFRGALKAYQRLLEIYPQRKDLERQIYVLKAKI